MTDTEQNSTNKNKRPSLELAGFQRKYLRGLAHTRKPLVQVGREGVTEGVVQAMAQALLDHELIKVRMHEPEDKKGMAAELARRSGSHLCGLVGHSAILYLPHPEEPEIVLPRRSTVARRQA